MRRQTPSLTLRASIVGSLAFLFVLLLGGAAAGEDGTVLRFPVVGRTRFPSGLKMEIDTRWVEAQGYRPVRIMLGTANGAPATADRTIRIDFKVYPRNNAMEQPDRITTYVTLPEGKATTHTTQIVLQEFLWARLEIETYDDNGSPLLDLSGNFNASASSRRVNQYYGWDQDALTFLVIDPDVPARAKRMAGTSGANAASALNNIAANGNGAPGTANKVPDIRALAMQIPDPAPEYTVYSAPQGEQSFAAANDPKNGLTDTQLVDWTSTRSNFEMLPPSEVPMRWLELTGFDFIILSMDEAEALAKDSPKRWEAVRQWTNAGGNLIVFGMGPAGERRAKLDELLRDAGTSDRWKDIQTNRSTTNLDFVNESLNAWSANQNLKTRPDIDKDVNTDRYFMAATRQAGLGYLIAINESDVFPGTRRQWTGLINSIPSWRALWSHRNGVSLSDTNSDTFWQFAIPGFGMAPVMLFVALISVFVVVLGPVNYAWLKRRKQLALLMFTVPLGALLTILSLSAYAILGDGFYTRVRIWSVTDLDQRTGKGISWSHQTYYAGIPPWTGLQFPTNAAVYPVDQLAEKMTNYYSGYELRRAPRAASWEEKQNLRNGYISSRTLSQFVVIQPMETEAKLIIKDGKATNQLGSKVRHLVARGDDEAVLYASNVEAGQTVELRPIAEKDQTAVAELLEEAKPQLMEGFDSLAYDTAMQRSSIWRGGGSYRTYTVTADGDGVLLEELKACEAPLKGKGAPAARSYLAIAEKAPEAPLGVESAIEVRSLHVIKGRW